MPKNEVSDPILAELPIRKRTQKYQILQTLVPSRPTGGPTP
jgi:hypothetical protein